MWKKWPRSALLFCACLATACGGSDGSKAADASPESDGEASGPISVTARIHGVPAAGIVVIPHEEGGSDELATGEDGTVDIPAEAATDITVIFPAEEGGRVELVSFLAVEPGAALDVQRPGPPDPTPQGSAAVTLSGAQAGASQYDVTLGCIGALYDAPADFNMPIATFDVPPSCIEDGAVDALALAVAPETLPAATGMVAFATRQKAIAEGEDVSLNLPAWSSDWLEIDLTINNLPADTQGVSTFAQVQKGSRGFPGRNLYTQDLSLGGGATASTTHRVPSGFGETAVTTEFTVRRRMSPDDSTTVWLSTVQRTRANDVTVDATSQLAPDITAAALDLDINSLTPTMTWQSPADLTAMSTGWLFLDYSGEAHWRIIFPPSRTAVPLPLLPTEHSPGFEPSASVLYFIKCASASSYPQFLAGYCPIFGFPGQSGDSGTVTWTRRRGAQ